MKSCSNKNCKQVNPQSLDSFHVNRSKKDGLQHSCKICLNEINKEWYDSNRSARAISQLEYQRANPDRMNAARAKRNAAKSLRTPPWLTEEHRIQMREIYELCGDLQWLNDPSDPLEVDHIVPLQGENVSGLHVPWNLQIIPKSLNCSYSNRMK